VFHTNDRGGETVIRWKVWDRIEKAIEKALDAHTRQDWAEQVEDISPLMDEFVDWVGVDFDDYYEVDAHAVGVVDRYLKETFGDSSCVDIAS
jgi:hypothetical protein